MDLPERLRPRGLNHKRFQPGLDLPSWFSDSLKSIDDKLHLVWHPYRVLWDDIMNQYEGTVEDSRFCIHLEHGEENWGWVLTDNVGAPLLDESWHIWRECNPHGWAHIVKIESKEGNYLKLLADRLHMQAQYRNEYGDLAWNRKLVADQEAQQEKDLAERANLFDDVQKENSWFMKKAMENFDRGVSAPTNPTRDQVISFPGQKNHTKTERPLDDTEGGLVTLDD